MNSPTETKFLTLRQVMEYLMRRTHELIMYSRYNIFNLNDIPHQCFFKSGSADIKNTRIIQLTSHIL